MEYKQNCSKGDQVAGMLYVPNQEWSTVYQLETGFLRGTIFPEMDKPWVGGNGCV